VGLLISKTAPLLPSTRGVILCFLSHLILSLSVADLHAASVARCPFSLIGWLRDSVRSDLFHICVAHRLLRGFKLSSLTAWWHKVLLNRCLSSEFFLCLWLVVVLGPTCLLLNPTYKLCGGVKLLHHGCFIGFQARESHASRWLTFLTYLSVVGCLLQV
jgi:hypothetical protein